MGMDCGSGGRGWAGQDRAKGENRDNCNRTIKKQLLREKYNKNNLKNKSFREA